MNEIDYLCVGCFHTITNPICSVCFIKEVRTWIRDEYISTKSKEKIIEELERITHNLEEGQSNTSCILCNSRKVDLCAFCLTLKTSRIIKKSMHGKKINNNFKEIFNYNICTH